MNILLVQAIKILIIQWKFNPQTTKGFCRFSTANSLLLDLQPSLTYADCRKKVKMQNLMLYLCTSALSYPATSQTTHPNNQKQMIQFNRNMIIKTQTGRSQTLFTSLTGEKQ